MDSLDTARRATLVWVVPAAVAAVAVVLVILVWLDQMHNVPFILALGGAVLGLIFAVATLVIDHREGQGFEAEGLWLLLVGPMLFLLPGMVLGYLVLLVYNLVGHGSLGLAP